MSWLLAFAGFAVLIILHEFGHFVAAKKVGMRVERFFLFFPPKLFSKKIGETEYGVGAIPLGGFVKITGMNPDEVHPEQVPADERRTRPDPLTAIESAGQGPEGTDGVHPLPPDVVERAYYNQPVWKRIVVIAAGPFVNIALAFVLLFALAFGVQEASSGIEKVEANGAAAGKMLPGDKLVSVDGVKGEQLDLAEAISAHKCPGEPTNGCAATTPATVIVERKGEPVTLQITPTYDEQLKRTRLGFAFGTTPVNPSVPEAARISADFMWQISTQTISVIARIFESEQREQISGVVGSYEVTRQAIEFDARTALTLLAVISLSLGLINLFPFLPLDGGHIFWSLVEKVRGRPVPFSVMERAGVVGFMLVIFLFFIGLSNDIGRLTGDGFGVR